MESAYLAVVILNYNTKHFLEKFLPLVLEYTPGAHIVVADNCSPDGSATFVRENFPTVQLIETPENLGFCSGYNYALRQLEADYYLLLNSDVEVTPGWLVPIVQLMEDHPEVACCQPKIKSYYERNKFEYAGGAGGMIDRLGYPFSRGRLFDHLEEDRGQYDDESLIFWTTGACMCIRASLYHQYGGLDDAFFAHMEEIDLCWRMKNDGHLVAYTGKSEVYHVGGGTLSKTSPRKTYFNFRNGLFLLFKNLPAGKLWSVMFIRLLLDGVAAFRFLGIGEWGNFWAVSKAHMHFYGRVPHLLRQRRQYKKIPNKLPREVYHGSIVWEYFIKGKKTYDALGETTTNLSPSPFS